MRTLQQWLNYQQLELIPDTTSSKIHLAARELWSGKAAPGAQVVCERGIVWLTQPNDPSDYILRPGQWFSATCHGKILVQALAAATISETIACTNKLTTMSPLIKAWRHLIAVRFDV